jgi:hypothetical protein
VPEEVLTMAGVATAVPLRLAATVKSGSDPHGSSWDMHQAGACPVRPSDDRLPAGTIVTGEVVCHHPFGLGIRLHNRDECGHVDVPCVSSDPVRGPEDFPPIGMVVGAWVVGYIGANAQLRLHLKGI